jgi:hypothetical protein
MWTRISFQIMKNTWGRSSHELMRSCMVCFNQKQKKAP